MLIEREAQLSLFARALINWKTCERVGVPLEDMWCGHQAPHPDCAHCHRWFRTADKIWNRFERRYKRSRGGKRRAS